jgi:hypothetical protein
MPRGVEGDAVGAGIDVALDVALGLGPAVGRVAGQHQVVPAGSRIKAPSKSPSSFQRMIWPIVLLARGLAASTPGWPGGRAALLLVSVQ